VFMNGRHDITINVIIKVLFMIYNSTPPI